jgi:hypothetical protein
MRRTIGCGFAFAGLLFSGLASAAAGEKETVPVSLLAQYYFTSQYQGQLPGSSSGQSSGQATCTAGGTVINCSSSGQSSGTVVPPRTTYDQATGAMFIVQAPDGRIAVVRCDSKYALHGDGINQRSCRFPPQRQFTAEFKGKDAKLRWSVGWDGKNTESETYAVIEVLSRDQWVNGGRERARSYGFTILD